MRVGLVAYIRLHLCAGMDVQDRTSRGSANIGTGLVVVGGDCSENICETIANHNTLQVDRRHSSGDCLGIVVENRASEQGNIPSTITLQKAESDCDTLPIDSTPLLLRQNGKGGPLGPRRFRRTK